MLFLWVKKKFIPKLYSSREIEKVLAKLDYYFIHQKGSHGKFKNKSGIIVILTMNKKKIPLGMFRSILKQVNISVTEFENII
jgi:predicted RNA binding protein YcfA (HicA-like mRNA interferase family)